MGNSLQDQLLKAGLANKKQAVKARKAKNHKAKLQRSGVDVEDETRDRAEVARQEKVERDRQLNREKNARAEAMAIQAQIRQLIELNRIEERGDIAFSYTSGNAVKTLQVDANVRQALVTGSLALVTLDHVEIVPAGVAMKIAERDQDRIVLMNSNAENAETDTKACDDEYADYQVPDDLMW